MLIALLDAEPLVRPVEGDDVSGRVVRGERLLRLGIAIRDQPLALEGCGSGMANVSY